VGRAGWRVLTATYAVALAVTIGVRPVILPVAALYLPGHVIDPVPGLHFSRYPL